MLLAGRTFLQLSSVFLLCIIASSQRQTLEPQFVVPNFPDLTIKIQRTNALVLRPAVDTLYLKGARQRAEHGFQQRQGPVPFPVMISQCDLQVRYILRPMMKTYSESHFQEIPPEKRKQQEEFMRQRAKPRTGPQVVVTYRTVDTGETKAIGSLQSHHLKTTITAEPATGAETQAGRIEADAWYLDVSGIGCMNQPPLAYLWQRFRFGANDRVITRFEGPEPRGLVVEGKAITRQAGNELISKVELLNASDQALDDSLFELPPGYTPATPGHPPALQGNPLSSDENP